MRIENIRRCLEIKGSVQKQVSVLTVAFPLLNGKDFSNDKLNINNTIQKLFFQKLQLPLGFALTQSSRYSLVEASVYSIAL